MGNKFNKIVCECCGKVLPVVIINIDGEVEFSVFCRYCKSTTIVKLPNSEVGQR